MILLATSLQLISRCFVRLCVCGISLNMELNQYQLSQMHSTIHMCAGRFTNAQDKIHKCTGRFTKCAGRFTSAQDKIHKCAGQDSQMRRMIHKCAGQDSQIWA